MAKTISVAERDSERKAVEDERKAAIAKWFGLQCSSWVEAVVLEGNRIAITYRKDKANAGEVLRAVSEAGLNIIDVSTREADLEDVFLNLTRAEAA